VKTLIIGRIPGFGESLSRGLARTNRSVTAVELFAENDEEIKTAGRLLAYRDSPSQIEALFAAFDFDRVVFIAPSDEFYSGEGVQPTTGNWLSTLARALDCAVKIKRTKKFVLVSSHYTIFDEPDKPYSGLRRVWEIKTAEEICGRYLKTFGLGVAVLRCPHVCCTCGFGTLERLVAKGRRDGVFTLRGDPKKTVEFMTDSDLCRLIGRLLASELSGLYEVGGENITLEYLSILVRKATGLCVKFLPADFPSLPETSKQFIIKTLNFTVSSTLSEYMDALVVARNEGVKKNIGVYRRFIKPVVPFLMTLIYLGALGIASQTAKSEPLALQKPVENTLTATFFDLQFLLVCAVALVWGAKAGLFAGASASALYLVTRLPPGVFAGGFSAGEMLSIKFLLPVALYPIGGFIIGFGLDRIRRSAVLAHEKRLNAEEKYQGLAKSYESVAQSNKNLSRQLNLFGDSMIRAYKIASELHQPEPERVAAAAIRILEENFESQNAVIYRFWADEPGLARLSACSRALWGSLSHTLLLGGTPGLYSALSKGEVFINREMDTKLPAYASFIFKGCAPVAIFMLREVPFSSYSAYHANLFRIITDFAEAAYLCAEERYNSAIPLAFFSGTNVYTHTALWERLEAKRFLRQETGVEFACLCVKNSGFTLTEADCLARTVIRSCGEVGLCSDGRFFIILDCAGRETAGEIANLIAARGVETEAVQL
jgi:nucleoside-diphosphate-sugar epimerase